MNALLRVLLPPATVALPVGIALGFAAQWVERRFAPVGLFPLLVGAVIGAASFGVGRLLGRTGRISLWFSTTLAALACCGTMHYASYLAAVRAAEADFETHQRLLQAFPQKGFVAPPAGVGTLGDFLAREWNVGRKLGPKTISHGWLGLWWALDALALLVAALSTALFCGERDRPTQPASVQATATADPTAEATSPSSEDPDSDETSASETAP